MDELSSKTTARAGVSVFIVLWLFIFWSGQIFRIIDTIKGWVPLSDTHTDSALLPVADVSDPAIAALYGNFNDLTAPGIIGIGLAEGTLDENGTPTSIYTGHTDPGNGAWNKGFGSWQASPVATAQDGDAKAFERIKTQCIPKTVADAKALGVPLTAALLAQVCDMWIQAPLAGENAIANYAKAVAAGKSGDAAILEMRVKSYYNPQTGTLEASGFRNDLDALTHDQQRRLDAVKQGLSKLSNNQSIQVTTVSAPATTDPAQSVLKVHAGGEWGTCFVAAPSVCVTNAHVMQRSDTATLSTANGQQFQAFVVRKGVAGPNNPDVAILKIQGGESLPVIPSGAPQSGPMSLIGYGYGKEQTTVSGTITQIRDRIVYQGDNQPGKSGGALIQAGKWVGLNVAMTSRGSEAITPEQVNQFLQGANQIPTVQRKSLI